LNFIQGGFLDLVGLRATKVQSNYSFILRQASPNTGYTATAFRAFTLISLQLTSYSPGMLYEMLTLGRKYKSKEIDIFKKRGRKWKK